MAKPMKVYHEKDADISIIRAMKTAVIGYGSQGRAHALSLKDSGVNVTVGLRKGGKSWDRAKADKLVVKEISAAVKGADVVMILLPDEHHAAVYREEIEPNVKEGVVLAFAHGFNVHYEQIIPRPDMDVVMVAPKAPGRTVREFYEAGRGVPMLIAVYQGSSLRNMLSEQHARDIALSYAAAIGGTRAGVLETNFREETETDLFGEQNVLCGGVVDLVKAGFETLTAAGYAEEMAYFECFHELKLIVDLMHAEGIAGMNTAISNNAEHGQYVNGPTIITAAVREAMEASLARIQSGEYARRFILENQAGMPVLRAKRRELARHPIETVGAKLRAMMPWLKK